MLTLTFNPQKFAAARKKAGLTQQQAADLVDRKYQHISHYETGVAKPPADVLATLAANYNTSLEEICDQTNS